MPMRWRAQLELAATLEPGLDYGLSIEERRVFLTARGQQRVATFAEGRGPPWRSVITREELARQALAAIHLFRKGNNTSSSRTRFRSSTNTPDG